MELGCITRSLIPVYLTKNKFAGMLQRSLWPQPGCSASNVLFKMMYCVHHLAIQRTNVHIYNHLDTSGEIQ